MDNVTKHCKHLGPGFSCEDCDSGTTQSSGSVHSRMSGKPEPIIGADIFKELINDMKNKLETNLGTKIDNINTRLIEQDLKINDLGQRVEKLDKHLTYADAAKSPPKPPIQNKSNTNTNTDNNAATNTNQTVTENKNHNLTAADIMNRSRH